MDDDVLVSRAEGAMDAVVDGRTVLLSPVDFSYHGLDAVGARVWGLLESPQTLGGLVDALVATYEVDRATCRADLQPFLERMVAIGTLTTSATP